MICVLTCRFGSKYVLQIHDTMRHKREANVCHVCAKEIRDKRSFEKHVRLHYEDSGPRIKCPHSNCESWLKDEDNLKLHLRRHKTEEKAYKCPECGKLYKNQRALTSHKKYTHSAEVFPCGECNKHFKKAITLKVSMIVRKRQITVNCFNEFFFIHLHPTGTHGSTYGRSVVQMSFLCSHVQLQCQHACTPQKKASHRMGTMAQCKVRKQCPRYTAAGLSTGQQS